MFPERIDAGPASLERFSADHVDAFDLYDLFREGADGVEETLAYVPWEPYATPKDARDELADAESSWNDGEVARYAVYGPGGDLAGDAGLIFDWDRRSAKLGCILARPHWGEGYACGAATALTELAFDRLDLELVAIGHEDGNDRSARFVERFVDEFGGRYDGRLRNWTPVGDSVLDHHRYTISREEYEESAGTAQG